MNRNIEPIIEAAKATPPVSIIGLTILGLPLSDWAVMGSVLLIGLQIFFLIRKEVYLPYKERRARMRL